MHSIRVDEIWVLHEAEIFTLEPSFSSLFILVLCLPFQVVKSLCILVFFKWLEGFIHLNVCVCVCTYMSGE